MTDPEDYKWKGEYFPDPPHRRVPKFNEEGLYESSYIDQDDLEEYNKNEALDYIDEVEGGDIAAEDNSIIEECQEEAEESTNNEEEGE